MAALCATAREYGYQTRILDAAYGVNVDQRHLVVEQLFRRLDDLDYAGLLSVEYFDLPDMGWGLEDPVAHATALAEQLRPLLGACG